ncbi:MAG TPA: methylenetetrahydrofolate reductase [NAD(P)H] [Syntrophales bacterium]|nr:methylenetetrahydrofolate reductase [NAD(P)H] [Syntrophales bacterium]HPQ45065.1 methylenetetrahydrofolate reductase [NAD(P)H] [Syntrophales bacterium]
MKIKSIFEENKTTLSFEFFPPSRDGNIEELYRAIKDLSELNPDFISVTYGAGGSTRDKTVEIASTIKNEYGRETLAHLTCVQATRDDIREQLDRLSEKGIENILALRGDPPKDEDHFVKTEGGFRYANELVEFIKQHGDFSIGVAGYPEVHPEAPDMEHDLINLKKKVDAGADFIITQMFFDNEYFYRYRDHAISTGIRVPIIPALFPIFNYKQITRIASLCGAKIPQKLADKLSKVSEKNEEVEKYGIEHAIIQSENLLGNDVSGLHFYSMNRSGHVIRIIEELPKKLFENNSVLE